MELNVLKKEAGELKIQFKNADQGFLNLIKDVLWTESGVEMAGFKIDHPETNGALFTLKTKGKAAKDIWNSALKTASDEFTSFAKCIKNL
ncbi:MAG: hypothetical protein J4451_00460 [DPANN group archaeon]|nr:hypothetical protein [DPANN group archaeon]